MEHKFHPKLLRPITIYTFHWFYQLSFSFSFCHGTQENVTSNPILFPDEQRAGRVPLFSLPNAGTLLLQLNLSAQWIYLYLYTILIFYGTCGKQEKQKTELAIHLHQFTAGLQNLPYQAKLPKLGPAAAWFQWIPRAFSCHLFIQEVMLEHCSFHFLAPTKLPHWAA